MKKYLVLLSLLIGNLFAVSAQSLDWLLTDENPDIVWEVKPQADEKALGFEISKPDYPFRKGVKAPVPGVVFSAYVAAGLVPDPNVSNNIHQVDEALFNRPFWYRTTFNTPKKLQPGERVWLHFDNTNRYADFYFNGHKISGTDSSTRDVSGHMIRSKFDVTAWINPNGSNAIAVLITDADQKKTRDAEGSFGVAASPTYLSAASWDWMPYVPGRLAGITGKAYLRIVREVRMEDPHIRSQLESNDIAYLTVASKITNDADQEQEVTVSGTIQPGNIRFSKSIKIPANSSSNIYFERKDFEELIVHKPNLWWPNGYGEPNLYTCELICEQGNQVSDEKTIKFGIREYSYQFVPNAAGWPVMNFYINGQKIFLKGGNWGMSEYLLRCSDEDYEQKIQLHKDMNYNMIRLWTGCVTDDVFYDYCDQYGIMVWDDFWLYVAYNDIVDYEDFKSNALDKIRRLRNHPSIALWCGANETHPKPELDAYLRSIVASEDHNDRMYKSSSNQDGLSGSGWWGNRSPKDHFENSGSNLAWNKPAYPYGSDRGYGLRTEIGTATFPTFESVREFIPKKSWWPLPTDEELKDDDDNVWNKHYFGKEASNANPIAYKTAVNKQYGTSANLEEFCAKAQFLNIEVMKGMYEAWNDKMWQDASGLLIWMSQSAYPSFVWQTYDYYHDATGAYWGAKKACEPLHIQWNSSTNSVKVINTTAESLEGALASVKVYDLNGQLIEAYSQDASVNVLASNNVEAFQIPFPKDANDHALQFIRLELHRADGSLLSENFYWRNAHNDDNYTDLQHIPAASLDVKVLDKKQSDKQRTFQIQVHNKSNKPAFGNRLRLVHTKSQERVLPIIASDNYFTLMPNESQIVTMQFDKDAAVDAVDVLLKQFTHEEKNMLTIY